MRIAFGLAVACLSAISCSREPVSTVAPVAAAPATTPAETIASAPRPANEHMRRIGEQALLVTAEPELSLEVQYLVDTLWAMHNDGARLYDGQQLALGWTTVSFRAERGPEGGEFFIASAPDYADSSGEGRTDDLTATFQALGPMRDWLSKSGAAPHSVNFDQHVLVARGALTTERVFWLRVDSPGGRLTGWRLAPVEMEGEMEVDSMPVHQIWRERPALLQTLLLPAGWMSYFDGDEVVAIVDPSDQVVWPPPEAGADE